MILLGWWLFKAKFNVIPGRNVLERWLLKAKFNVKWYLRPSLTSFRDVFVGRDVLMFGSRSDDVW